MRARHACWSLVVVAAMAVPAGAQDWMAWAAKTQAAERQAERKRQDAIEQHKRKMAEAILQAREQAMGRDAFAPSFTRFWVDKLAALPLDELEDVYADATAVDLNAVTRSLTPDVFGMIEPYALGDSAKDLVFTKVNPCRIVDTRVAGGPLGYGGSRSFYAVGSVGFSAQGGNPTGCGVPVGATAVSVNLIAVGPAGPGWLRAYPYAGPAPNASVINYTSIDIANGYIQPICDPAATSCGQDFTVLADANGTHVVIDVTGYFMKVDKGQYRSFSILAGSSSTIAMAAHPACTNYLSVTITAPVAGRIVVTAHAQLAVSHVSGTSDGTFFGVSTSATTCTFTNGWTFLIQSAALPTDTYYPTDTTFVAFDVTAGTRTYYLNGYRNSANAVNFWYGELQARFEPQ